LIIEKRKTQPDLQKQDKFYAAMVGYLLRYVYEKADGNGYRQVIVTTDTLPLKKKEKALRESDQDYLVEHVARERDIPRFTS
jgi:hypothetical protein